MGTEQDSDTVPCPYHAHYIPSKGLRNIAISHQLNTCYAYASCEYIIESYDSQNRISFIFHIYF